MNQFTYLIPFILLVYGSREVVSYNQSEPKNETETCNSTQIMSNRFIKSNKIDELLLRSENFTETSKRNTSKNSNETFKRNENLITSKPEDEEPISFTRSSLSVPSAPTSEEDTTKNKRSALQKKSTTKWKKVTTKTFVSLEEDAETISNIAVTSESTASTSTSLSNTSQGKLTTKSEKATTKIFVSSEEGVVETTTKISVPSSESTSAASASPLSTLQEKSTKKRKEKTTKVFVSLEAGATGTTQTLPSESTTSISTSPSNTDAKSSFVSKMISQAFPTTVIAKRSIPGSLSQKAFEPVFCDIGHYGSSCFNSCEACFGKLCDKNGNCRFENVLHCDNLECWLDIELKPNSESMETPSSLIINYTVTFYHNHNNLILMYWTYENNKFEYQERPIYNGNTIELTVNYNTFYVVCVLLLYQNTYLANVKCQTYFVCSRCIENLSNVNIYQKNVVWKKNRSDLLRYRLHYSFQYGSCGQHSNNFFINRTNLATYANPDLKGTWKICVVCEEEEEGLENFCNVKEYCKTQDFGEETLKVTDLTVEEKNFDVEVSWIFPESWTLNCANVSFKLKVQSKTMSETKLYSFSSNHCFKIFNNLLNGFYTFEVTPIFGQGIEGSSSSQSINISNCPQQLIHVNAVEKNGQIFVNWHDNNDNIQGLHYIMSVDSFELCKNPTNLRYIELEGRKKEFNFTKIESTFGLVIKVKPWVEGCPTLRFEPSTLKNNETVLLSLENYNVSSVEDSVKLTWKIPSQWKHVCVIKSFIVRLIIPIYPLPFEDSRALNQYEICDDLTCAYIWENELQPFKLYTFKVFTLFENQVSSGTVLLITKTLEAHPKVPKTPVITTVKDEKVSISYNLKSYLNTLYNRSCQLTFREMNSDEVQPQLVNCINGKGKVENKIFREGRHYNVSVKICNTRSCKESPGLEFWTEPEKPTFKEQIVISPSVNNKITLLFPSYKKQQKGSIYIVVIKGDASTLNISDIEDYVKGKNEPPQTTRTRRSIQEDVKPDIMVVDIVDINTEKYELKAEEVFKENETRTAISVAAVFAPEAGELRSYGSTGIIGPITFPSVGEPGGEDTDSWVAWLMVCLLILVGGSVGLSICQRRKSALSFKDILKIRIPENERVETGEHVSNSPKEDKDSSANMRQGMKRPSITESALALFTSKAESSASLEDTSFNAPLCDESTPECDVYANIEPNRPYIEGLEFYLLQASYSPSLEKEFRSIPVTAHGKTFQEGVRSENRLKNRYQNNIPYDDTRVVLPLLDGIPNTDYINANIVQLTTGKSGDFSTYILTQGPIKRWGVISDFWRMVWYENVSAIVMLTNLIESGKIKCDQYWPEEGDECKCKDEIIVTAVSVEIRNSFVIRTFTISKDEEVRQVVQYHYTDWPDHGVPVEASPIANMVNLVRSYHPYGPTVVHCSAGIGRTGCFVLVNMCLEEYQLYNPIDFKKSLLFLRKCRSKLVQNFAQYQFSHYLLWVILFESTTTYLTSEFPFKWRNEIQNLEQEDPNDPRALSKQFQKLKTFQNNLTYFVAMDKDIRYKYNRFKNILPADSKRVSLLSVDGRPQDLYINAIMVDGFSKKDGYIVAEYPMESTIVRVWYMILERQIPVWIFLNDMTESLDDTYPPIVPTADVPFEFGELNVSLLSSTSHEYFIENWVKIEGNFQGSETLAFECRVIQFLGWSSSSIVPETGPEQLFSMLDYIYSGGPYNSPLLFTCADGVTACGAALALDITRQRSEAFGEVNIFSSCIRIINCRPEFIVSLEQYCLLNDYIASYILLSDQEIYENIQTT